uniref:Uncharacterized protein n=1 Tax=Anguilla anguilla TaxID=7936 RepID=A0A0E9VH02_ANGAN
MPSLFCSQLSHPGLCPAGCL